MASRLTLSFWDLCLDNLPQGRFERSTITAAEARAMIQRARATNTLLCVSKHDLLAPYRKKQRRNHDDLCTVLQNTYDIALRFEDFLSSIADENGTIQTVIPLQVACLQPGERMLVVSCNYAFAQGNKTGDPDQLFTIAADSVSFSLIAALVQ